MRIRTTYETVKNDSATAHFQTRSTTIQVFQGISLKLIHLKYSDIVNTKFSKEKSSTTLFNIVASSYKWLFKFKLKEYLKI